MKRTPDKLAWKRWGLGLWFGAVCALSLCGWGLLAGGLPQAGAVSYTHLTLPTNSRV